MRKTAFALGRRATDIVSLTTIDSVFPLFGERTESWAVRLQSRKLFRGLIVSKYTVPLLVLVGFFIFSFGFNGPAYMSDEVGYLDKAATIAGSTVHLSTSWFGGYSLMISPAFFLSANPTVEWNIISILNGMMWAGSAAFLQYILAKLFPNRTTKAIRLATLGAMLYPSWISMSSYAFATSGFVLIFMAALAAIVKSELKSAKWLTVAGLLAGYLCWIHPLGFLFLGLFVTLLLLQGVRTQPKVASVAGASLVTAITYIFAVQPWFDSAMKGSITNDDHYAAGAHGILHAVTTLHYWLQVGEVLVGLLFFAIVASFGLVVYGAMPVLKELLGKRKTLKSYVQDSRAMVRLLPVLLVFGVIGLTALQFAADKQLRMDQWVYGRYTDMYLLPLLGFGLLANWKPKAGLKLAAFVLGAGILLSLVSNSTNTLTAFNNKANIQALWPMHIASAVHANQYWVWGVLGMCGVLVCGMVGKRNRKVYLMLLLVPIVLAGASNYIYKQTITHQHATVSSLYDYLKTSYSTSDCIGFTPVPDSHERFNLYSYYLHGYDVKKMSLQQWQQQQCQGPYLTYDATAGTQAGLQVVGVEPQTGLYVFTHSGTPTTFSFDTRQTTTALPPADLLSSSITFR